MNHKIIYENFPSVKTIDGAQCFDNEGNLIEIDLDLYNEKLAIWESGAALRALRRIREIKLAESDWWVLPDRTATQAQLEYRQALRDLPANSSPELDENGQLINVNWPEKPE